MTTINPLFLHLSAKYQELRDLGLDRTPEASRIFMEMMSYAPEAFMGAAHQVMVEMELLPVRPDGYGEDGQPLYNVEAIAKRLNIDPATIPEHLLEGAYAGRVHSVN